MPDNPITAMATWVGALARGGLLYGQAEEQGAELAFDVLGEERLVELREWFAEQESDVVEQERRGAIHACIWMAHADREVAKEELELLEEMIGGSDLKPEVQRELVDAIQRPSGLDAIAGGLTQPGLRELMLAFSWQLAWADERLEDEERTAHGALASAFSVSEQRAEEIREATASRIRARRRPGL